MTPPPPPSDAPLSPLEEAIFHAAADLTNARARADFLARACSGDPALRARVEALLAADERAARFFDDDPLDVARASAPGADGTPAPGPTSSSPAPSDAAEEPRPTPARYKLLEKIGEGGCGVVYVAEQTEPVARRVAIKVIKPGMDTRVVIARFEAERQALALMDHPNIARVLDAGATEQGRPYFVMELVRGVRITDHCEQNSLPARTRIELFAQVCHAIQHAHQKGVIHRDIKPSNILVTLHDGAPVPKVIDFGIAKAVEGRLTDATVYTRLHQFIGTPAYMSPEQAEPSGLDVDTRSDIYSLGVLLYELLAGATPFDAKELAEAGLDAMRKTIREQEPLPPSAKLTRLLRATTVSSDHAANGEVARRRQQMQDRAHLLRGDLDAIVLKCLEKDRRRRYDTANALADDLRRHLDHEPVSARPAGAAYKLRKLVRRNQGAFAAAAAILLVLLAGATVSTWQAVRATRATRHALAAQATEAGQRRLAEQARQDAEREAVRARCASARSDARMFLQTRFAPEAHERLKEVFSLGAEWEDGLLLHQIAIEARGRWTLAARLPAVERPQAGCFLTTPKGARLIIATTNDIRVVNSDTGETLAAELAALAPGVAPVRTLLPGAKGTFIAVTDGEITVRDGDSARAQARFPTSTPTLHASVNGPHLLVIAANGTVRLLDRLTLASVDHFSWTEKPAARDLPPPDFGAASPDGKLVVLRGGPWWRPAVLWDRRQTPPVISTASVPAQQLRFVDDTRFASWRILGRGDSDEVGYLGLYRIDRAPVLETQGGLYSPDLKGQLALQTWDGGSPQTSPMFGLIGRGGLVVRNLSRVNDIRTTDRLANLTPLDLEAPELVAADLSRGWLALRHRGELSSFTQSGSGYGNPAPVTDYAGCASREGLFCVTWNILKKSPQLTVQPFDPLARGRFRDLAWPVSAGLRPWALAVAPDAGTVALIAQPEDGEAAPGNTTDRATVRALIYHPGDRPDEPDEPWTVAREFAIEASPTIELAPRFAALSPEGGVLLYWNGGASGLRYDTRTGQVLAPCELGAVAARSRDGGRVAAVTAAGRLRVYEVATGAILREWPATGGIGLCFSTDAASLVIARENRLDFEEIASGELLRSIPLPLLPLAYAPEVERLVALQPTTQGPGGMLVLVDTTAGQVTEVLDRAAAAFTPAWFSDDGRGLAVIGDRRLATIRRSLRLEELPGILEMRPRTRYDRGVESVGAAGDFGFNSGRRMVVPLMLRDINADAAKRSLLP